jgi:hypothetical protein
VRQQVFVHPQVHVRQEIVTHVSLHHFQHLAASELAFKHFQPTGEAVVVENKLAGMRGGARYKVKAGTAVGSVVVATASWRGFNPETHASLWNTAQNPNIIGRVSIVQQVRSGANPTRAAVFCILLTRYILHHMS